MTRQAANETVGCSESSWAWAPAPSNSVSDATAAIFFICSPPDRPRGESSFFESQTRQSRQPPAVDLQEQQRAASTGSSEARSLGDRPGIARPMKPEPLPKWQTVPRDYSTTGAANPAHPGFPISAHRPRSDQSAALRSTFTECTTITTPLPIRATTAAGNERRTGKD